MRRRKFSATSRPSWKIVICFIVPAMPPDNSKRTSHNGVAPAWFPAVTAGTHADTNKVTANALAESKAPRIFTFLLDRHRPRERLRDTRSRDAQRLQQGLEILAPGRSLHGSAQLHDSRLRRAPLACSREAQIPAQRRELQLGALAAALPQSACGIAERECSAARALERESEPRGRRIHQEKNQIRGCAQNGQPDAGAAKSPGHAPCTRNSSRPFTVPGLAPLSSVALSARRPVCCCSSTSHAISAANGASSICTRTAFAPSASTRLSRSRRPCRSAACPTAAAGLAGSVTRGAARRLATRAACSCTRASCAWTETRRERARARPPSTGVQTSR